MRAAGLFLPEDRPICPTTTSNDRAGLPTTDETNDYRLDYRLLTTDSRLVRRFLVLYAASGAAALVYEVTWTRLLALQLGHTVAAASTVLAAFMGGLAIGAWLARRLTLTPLRVYATLE